MILLYSPKMNWQIGVNTMTYGELRARLNDMAKVSPEKLGDDIKVVDYYQRLFTISYALWNDGSIPDMKPHQLFLSEL